MMAFSFLLLMLTIGASVAEAGKLVYEAKQTKAEVVCPDQEAQCPGDSTCCQLPSGRWGCCRYPEATCCSDNLHCCPKSYSCDVNEGRCVQATTDKTVSWAKKMPASVRSKEVASPENVVCPDGTPCPGSFSCCKNFVGFYSCCVGACCPGGTGCCFSYSRRTTYPPLRTTTYATNVEWSLIVQDDN